MQGTANQPSLWPWPDALDAVVAAPGSHRVVLENQTTRVLAVTIAPGEREPEHTHRWPSVMVVHRPARIRYYTGETLTFTSPELPAPAAQVRAQAAPMELVPDPEVPVACLGPVLMASGPGRGGRPGTARVLGIHCSWTGPVRQPWTPKRWIQPKSAPPSRGS